MNIEKPWRAPEAHGTPNAAELDDVKAPSALRLLHGVCPYGRKHTIPNQCPRTVRGRRSFNGLS
jgi:hypothetical protein